MRLAVATLCSHTLHEGRWWSYEPYVREANRWASIFEELHIVAPVESGPPAPFSAPYDEHAKIELLPFRHDRGRGVDQARTRFWELPKMWARLLQARRRTDAMCLRAPSNIALAGLLLGPLLGSRRLARYTGQWTDYPGEARSYRLQRKLLASRWWGATTFVYGERGEQPSWVVPSFNAILTEDDLPAKSDALPTTSPPRILFVGRLSRAKNVHVLLRALAEVRAEWALEILGDGPERDNLERLCAELDLDARVSFRGATPFEDVVESYREADALVLASETEGWPKALVEGMSFGLACVASDRGLMPDIVGDGRGWLVEPGNIDSLRDALREIVGGGESVEGRRLSARTWARQYTLDGLERQIVSTLNERWETRFPEPRRSAA
ncbi:MAG: glycosyltransferase [Acidobacteriota bacterium]